MSKRKRKRTSVKNRINGANSEGIGEVSNPQPQKPEYVRIPSTDAAWEAGQLHEARADNCELKQKLLEQEQVAIQKDQLINALRQKINAFELDKLNEKRTKVDEANTKLRETYGLVVGRQLKKDPETGEVYQIITKPEGQ